MRAVVLRVHAEVSKALCAVLDEKNLNMSQGYCAYKDALVEIGLLIYRWIKLGLQFYLCYHCVITVLSLCYHCVTEFFLSLPQLFTLCT